MIILQISINIFSSFPCPIGESCVLIREEGCPDFLCPTKPECKAKKTYASPCTTGAPLTDDEGNAIICKTDSECPSNHGCSIVADSGQSVCCPVSNYNNKKPPTSKYISKNIT